MTMCVAAGCMADAVEDVPMVESMAWTQDAPMDLSTVERLPACAEHALLLRQKGLAPYGLRVILQQPAVLAASERLQVAASRAADPADVALVQQWLDDHRQLARLAEDSTDRTWQETSARLEELATRLQPLVERHRS